MKSEAGKGIESGIECAGISWGCLIMVSDALRFSVTLLGDKFFRPFNCSSSMIYLFFVM